MVGTSARAGPQQRRHDHPPKTRHKSQIGIGPQKTNSGQVAHSPRAPPHEKRPNPPDEIGASTRPRRAHREGLDKGWLPTMPQASLHRSEIGRHGSRPCPSGAQGHPAHQGPTFLRQQPFRGGAPFYAQRQRSFPQWEQWRRNSLSPKAPPSFKARAPSMASGKRPRARTLETPRDEPRQRLGRHHRARQDHEGLPNPRVGRLQFTSAPAADYMSTRGAPASDTRAHTRTAPPENGSARASRKLEGLFARLIADYIAITFCER